MEPRTPLPPRLLDSLDLLPASLIDGDPLYANIFLANMGSIGMPAVWHHLYEYGTIPLFGAVGRVHKAPRVLADGTLAVRDVAQPQLEIVIDDDGPGLPEAQRPAALARGRRLDETKPGSGLGLSIVRTLVTTELGGSIAMRGATADDYRDADITAEGGSGTLIELSVPLGSA